MRLAGFETRITETCGPPAAVYKGTSRHQRAPGAHKSYPLTLSSRLYLSTDAFFNSGRTTAGNSSIDSLQTFAHPLLRPPFSGLRFHRTAAVVEIQSVEEREKLRPGCENRLLFERENTLFSVLRTDEWGADLDAGGEAALHAGPPHAATRRPPHHTTQQPVGRRDRAAPLAVALVFGPTPSRCAALQNAPAEPSGAASEIPP